MRIIHQHPGQTGYHDNSEWVKLSMDREGYWMLPGNHVAIVSDADIARLDPARQKALDDLVDAIARYDSGDPSTPFVVVRDAIAEFYHNHTQK